MSTAISFSKTGAKHQTDVQLDATVFAIDANHELIDRAYRMYLANGRSSHAATLTRGLVRGGGKKPWRQKGTGRARVGSSRVPNWRGGGQVFGPTGNENHTLGMPVKMKRAAIRQALSLQANDGHIAIIESFASAEGRVKPTVELLTALKLEGHVMLVVAEKTPVIDRATRNVEGLEVISAKYLNVFSVMNADHIVMTADALTVVNEWLGDK
jgi:large subunit ribosomal protein L4